jgi:hypothetical protein
MLGSGVGRFVGFGFVQYLRVNVLGGCGFGRSGEYESLGDQAFCFLE